MERCFLIGRTPPMSKLLTRLKVREISLVDRGAGEGTRVMLWKRDTDAEKFRKIFADTRVKKRRDFYRDWTKHLHKQDDADADNDADLDTGAAVDTDNDAATGNNHAASLVADLLCEAQPGLDRASALYFLLHHQDGAALLQRLRATKQHSQKEQPPMTRSEELSAIAKGPGGIAVIAKHVLDGKSTISEHELTKLIGEYGKQLHPNLTTAAAFSKVFEDSGDDGTLLRQAVAASRAFQV